MNTDYRFVFFGTPLFSVRVLDSLEAKGFVPALIISAPDKPRGRGLVVSPSPVKKWAQERGIDVLTPETLKDGGLALELANTEWDFFITAAYGKIIPKAILDIPRKGSLNVHPSLLPKFRGPSPVISAILADARETGVTIMLMDEKMDHVPIIAQARIEIEKEDWPMRGSVLEALLATEGGTFLAETIPDYMNGDITPYPQDESQATYTKKFLPKDAYVIRKEDPYQNLLKIRAFDTNPRAHFHEADDYRVVITDATMIDGKLEILRVIPEGKREMSYQEYLKG